MPDEKKEFTVKDRRVFSTENQDVKDKEKEDQKAETDDRKPERGDSKEEPKDKNESRKEKKQDIPRFPPINFATFILSLNSSALVQLGIIEDPMTRKTEKNLPLAKQTIDILGMIEEKTKGNLTNEEQNILKHLLYDLRMIYVREMG